MIARQIAIENAAGDVRIYKLALPGNRLAAPAAKSELLIEMRPGVWVPESRLLPKDAWEYWLVTGEKLLVMCWDDDPHVGYGVFPLSNLPNDFITAADLKRIGIHLEQERPVYEVKLGPRESAA